MTFFGFKHLLLVDLSSSGVSFYLAKNVSDLASIDFTNLLLLEQVFTRQFCRVNLLADDLALKKVLDAKLRAFDLQEYALVFLLAPDHNELEKKAIGEIAPFLKKVIFVERHFFYNFYLLQKRNFSSAKLLINLFDDCAELSFFEQDKLLNYEKVFLRDLAFASKNFWHKTSQKYNFQQPDCFYFFINHLPAKMKIDQAKVADLAKYLKLEAVTIEKLC